MSKESEKPNEFKRYRQALAAIYLATIAAGSALLAASVIAELFIPPDVELEGRPVVSAENPDPEVLLECNRQVHALYDRLGRTTVELLSAPPKGDERNLGRAWETFGRDWLEDWHIVNAQCRFEDLSGLSGSLGPAYERMAEVHGDLRAMRLKYQSLLVRFDNEQAAELRRMKRALDKSREALEALVPANAGGKPGAPQPNAGN